MELALQNQKQSNHYKFRAHLRLGLAAPAILLVEAHPASQQAHLHLLRRLNCKVDLATSGRQAIQLSKHAYDLILLDLHLPDLCSIEVSKIIKAQHQPTQVPIIALTTQAKDPKLASIDGFITKPIAAENMITLLTRWI